MSLTHSKQAIASRRTTQAHDTQCSMLVVDVLYCGALMLCWTRLCAAQQVSHGQRQVLDQDPTTAGDHHTGSSTETRHGLVIKDKEHTLPSTETSSASHRGPCFVDDIFAELREGVGDDGGLTNRSLALFGVCTGSDSSSGSVLLELAKKTNTNHRHGLEVLHPAGVLLGEDERGTLRLTFDLPQSPLLKLNPVLLLPFENPLTGENLDVTFTSQSLHPNTQSVCISAETQYIMLTGRALPLQGIVHQKWIISVATESPDKKQSLKDIFIVGKSGSMAPLLLSSVGRGTDTSYTHVSGSSSASSQTSSFLCELKRFLGDVLPRDQPESPPLQLNSLHSLPPLTLGLSSSETLLAGLINSSAPTVFSFAGWGSDFQVDHRELSLSPALLEELRQRLDQTVTQVMEVIREEEEVGHRATKRLGRLKELSAFPNTEPAAGQRQYRAFLLLKALQMVTRTNEVQMRMRATRADPTNPVRATLCRLKSLTVSLEKRLVGPNTANINNCHGSCSFPLVNTNNHAVLLYSHIESDNAEDERPPCCVPVAYETLEVVDLNEHGTYLSIKPDVVARECGCR